jgi:hypothetical protein
MTIPDKVKCDVHGTQDEAFVCQHIFRSLHTGVPVGFYWADEYPSKHPDAWCSACEEARVAAGGEWMDEAYELLDIKLVCGACHDYAKDIWLRGHKLTQ